MARPLRIEFSGALYHVTSRGDGREDIFLDDRDREGFLDVLAEVSRRFALKLHAYCLMDNHYHLVAETPEANLSRALRQLNGVYTQRFNRRHGRVGHVFQGRYKAILVERESYFLEVVRYVLLNPVRAGRVKAAGQWPWSSYRAVMGEAPGSAGFDPEPLLARFGATAARARGAFRRFVAAGIGAEPLWERLTGQIYLGDERFAERMQKQAAPRAGLAEVPRAQRRGRVRPLAAYARRYRDRDRAMAEAYRSGQYTLGEIAAHFGVHYATVSRAVRRVSANKNDNV
jgi:REP element-mobilizing transposase RayT